MVNKVTCWKVGDGVKFMNHRTKTDEIGTIYLVKEDGTYTVNLVKGGQKVDLRATDLKLSTKEELSKEAKSHQVIVSRRNSYEEYRNSKHIDPKARAATNFKTDPKKQKVYLRGTPVKFTYTVTRNGVSGQRSAVGTVHRRDKEGFYDIQLTNGTRKTHVYDATKCNPSLLVAQRKSEHGMITHMDAIAKYPTANTLDAPSRRKSFVLVKSTRKVGVYDAKHCDKQLLEDVWKSEHGMVVHVDAMSQYHTNNADDAKTLQAKHAKPASQLEHAVGTPVQFSYVVQVGSMEGRKFAVGKVHSRQENGTYTIDLVNGTQKVGVDDAKQCDKQLLVDEWKSEHGMVDAMAQCHTRTVNADDTTEEEAPVLT